MINIKNQDNGRIEILPECKYKIEWEESTKTAYIVDTIKECHLEEIEIMLVMNGYRYKNIKVGKPNVNRNFETAKTLH